MTVSANTYSLEFKACKPRYRSPNMHEPRCRFLQLVVDKIQGREVLSLFPSIHHESEDEAEAILKYGYIVPRQAFESMPILPALSASVAVAGRDPVTVTERLGDYNTWPSVLLVL